MLEITKDNFDELVKESKKLVLVDYFSDGCEPCKALVPHIEELGKIYGDRIEFYKFNTSKARRLAIKEKVLGLPTITIYENGEKKNELTKEDATKENIEKMILKSL
ncbi:thioredoxin domain-containing protein [uncultured Cetobacterium sp.]|uniref:thioredoxin TrxA n=1 Tax=uncultured Cetobacterium sp. TaxID=527638 RepID=UPI002637659C|nr:thioredoxin domain-containing protein [uncultured Cetobacterium sp.]